MYRKIFLLILLVMVMFQFSCDTKSEEDLYQELMSIDKPQERINELEKFLTKYPENKNKDKIFYRMFRDFVSLKDETNAVIYADKYLDFFPKNDRMSKLNSVSWILAENKMCLDSAKVYADIAVQQARDSDTRTLNRILDTQAYVYFQAGDAKKALTIQMEAMAGNEDDYDYLSRLGIYQYGAGENGNAYNTIAKSVLLGGGLETGKQLEKWIEEDFENEKKRIGVSRKIANDVIGKYLKDGIDENKKSQCAVLLSILKVELNKAKKWAMEAVQNLDEDSSFNLRLNYNINLASVYKSTGKHSQALKVLQTVEEYASIYDLSFWFNLGKAYLNNNQKEKAIDTFINGLLWRETPEFLSVLTDQGLNQQEIDFKIENKKNELMNFHPGKLETKFDSKGRIILTELFTGAECSPCKGADLAMDLIAEYYPRSMVTILEYHLHIPGPDPLTNPDTEARRNFYGNNFGTPTAFFNGHGKIVGGGSELVKKDSFNKYKKSIEKYFTANPATNIKLNANLKNGIIEVNSEVEFDTEFADKTNLNIAIVEKSVNYIGGNGITKHAFVVRYLMTGAEGKKLGLKKSTFTYSDQIEIKSIQNIQSQYLSDFESNPPKRFRNFAGWKERKEKINPEQLAVVAWIQNNDSKEILQSKYFEL
jgi:Flp pilus assembly protein TadD